MTDTRFQELAAKLLDHELSAPETAELAQAIKENPALARDLRRHLVLWELYSQRATAERSVDVFVASCETRLRAEADSDAFVARVEARLLKRSTIGSALLKAERRWTRWRRAAGRWITEWRAGLAIASVAALLIAGLSFWWPVVGQPVLVASESGIAVVERDGILIPAAGIFSLKPLDIVKVTGTSVVAISYAPENTQLRLHPGTAMRLLPWENNKHFDLRLGGIDAAVARQRLFHPLLIRTPQADARVLGTKFTLTTTTNFTRLDVSEGQVHLTRTADGANANVSAGNYAVAADRVELRALPQTGRLLREYWNQLPGNEINDLLDHPSYPDRPDGFNYVDMLEVPAVGTTNYGCRLVGYLHPPVTGPYIFWIAASPAAAFSLSRDENSANAVRLFSGGFDFGRGRESQPREWERKVLNMRVKSQPITLVAGRRYFIEAIHKADDRVGHLAVAWTPPGGEREVIAGKYLSPLKSKLERNVP